MKLKVDKLDWFLENKIGKLFSFKLFNYHFSIHVAKYKKGYWYN